MTLATFLERSQLEPENWRYTNLTKLIPSESKMKASNNNGVAQALPPDQPRFVFVNGVWQSKQSSFGTLPSCILLGDSQSGYTLTVGEHTCLVTQSINIVFLVTEDAPAEIAIKLSIDIGDNGRLTLLEHHPISSTLTTLETDIRLHSRAKFVHGKLIAHGPHLARTSVAVAAGASYNNFTLIKGGQPVRNEIDVSLDGPEAQAILNGIMLLRHQQHADTTIRVAHRSPNCSSRQVYKSVLDDKAHGVFQGKILVAEDAQKTDGYQLSRALLLSDQAEISAKPELEIYADDVKCSHGSAIGDLDENALFYLRARGLNELEARALLIDAFIGELLDEIHVEDWPPLFRSMTEGWLR